MKQSSPEISFDNRLLAIEEQFRQRKYSAALHDLSLLTEAAFVESPPEYGLYLSLAADGSYYEGNYRKAIEQGLASARLLAGFPLNRRYGKVQLILSKAYVAVGDLKNADARARDALAAYRRAEDVLGQVDALNSSARISYIRCDYHAAIESLEEAIGMIDDNPRKLAQVTGNLGMLLVHVGEWAKAAEALRKALQVNIDNRFEIQQAINLLSMGILALVQRQFVSSRRRFEEALDIIERHGLKREKVIALKYAGELAFEKGDTFKAKALLTNAYQSGLLLSPDSALVSQAGRRLADVELALDNLDDAMKHAQKALELAMALGEKVEVALARRVIAQVFAARGDFAEAVDNIRLATDLVRKVDDPYELARTLLVQADILIRVGDEDARVIRAAFEEAGRLFKRLRLDYWIAETEFKTGVYACQQGDLSGGFRRLNRAEKLYLKLEENARVRAVHHFLQSLSEQAVALSISQENEFKIFGNLIGPSELSDLKSSQLEDILTILLKKTGGDRAVIFAPEADGETVYASLELTAFQKKRFAENFSALLGEEISRTRPTLNLDCRRDPFINELLADIPAVVASILVVPFRMSAGQTSFLYVDRLTSDSSLNPFSQSDLNFAVGFSDLIAFRWAEIEKNRLLEDNRRLKSQLMEQAAFPNIITRNHKMLDVLAQV
ncbi:MAG TPA: tetratricopeptide repeat protein, partial [candidate division Zixibacteria bacterium]|nr:tetratricopeptide repeat protein [candidate division Zixibacteria bacterium]